MARTHKRYKTAKNSTRKKQTNDVKRITIKKNHNPEEGEKEIPLNVYTPELLPIPSHYDINYKKICHYFSLTQTETADEFTASVKATYDGFEILVGGDKLRGCVILTIKRVDRYNPESLIEAMLDVKHNEFCNITNDLSSGIGTITLMRTAISFMFTYFKVDKFILKDTSIIKCPDSIKVSLPALYILKYGESWYKKHINARIYNKTMITNIKKYKNFVSSKPSWEYLYNTYILPDLNSNKEPPSDKIIMVLYDAWYRTSSYKDFILDLNTNDDNCYLLDEWFNNIFDDKVDIVFYGQVDNFVLYDEFPFIKGLHTSYMKSVENCNIKKETDSRIKTFLENKNYTYGGWAEKDKIIFTEIIFK